jgi:hypothetical protein
MRLAAQDFGKVLKLHKAEIRAENTMRTAGGTEAEVGGGGGGGGGDGEGSGADGESGGAREFAGSAHDPQQVPCALPQGHTRAKRAFSHTHFSLPLTRTRSPLVSLACTNTIFAFFLCLSSGPTAFLLACITHFLACLCF